jgi:predicted NAD/FAD-binding protein
VVLAAHSDQSLAMLADPPPAEQAILGAIPLPCQRYRAAHGYSVCFRARERAWASWNYCMSASEQPERDVDLQLEPVAGT